MGTGNGLTGPYGMNQFDLDSRLMTRALELAAQGQGAVEPNPLVGCVLARGDQVVGQGWHQRFGGPHAEIEALRDSGDAAHGATMYVTLEPCCHQGKTPPCTQAILDAGIQRVVVAMRDPFPQVDGGGIEQLRSAGIAVDVGTLQDEARKLNAPYLKLLETGKPWVIVKWAMTLDGKLATGNGDSRWISNEQSREIVHQLRGRVDAVLVGRGTAEADDPLLTARPPGHRTATRIVLDSQASLPIDSQLAGSVDEAPVLVVACNDAPPQNRQRLTDAGCEVLLCDGATHAARLEQLLVELGRRHMTNLLVEGGSQLLGSLFDAGAVDEVHVFIAPKIIGGAAAPSPIAGEGLPQMSQALGLDHPTVELLDGDVYLHGRIAR